MDQGEIDLAVLSNVASVQGFLEPQAALRIAQESNDHLAEVVRARPDRFAAFATTPLQHPEEGAKELQRAVEQLGLVGTMLFGHTDGRYLDDRSFDPFWERAQDLDVPVYLHAAGATIDETLDQAAGFVAEGYRHVRLQTGQPGLGTYGAPGTRGAYPGAPYPDGWSVDHYLAQTPRLFAAARERLGGDVELLHDVHSRLTPKQAVVLARALEPYRLFFLEDVIAPEHYDRLPEVRAASPVPIAVGELTATVADAARLVTAGGVDLLRCHISAIGGLTPGRKLADLCELSGVQTAWHAPADVSPVGAAANLALDLTSPAFGIQEGHVYPAAVHEIFPGTPVIRAGYAIPSESPGWGIELDEKAAEAFPPVFGGHERWTARVRRPDGAVEAP